MDKRTSIVSFHSRFDTEEKCISYLEKVRWNGAPACPRCGHPKAYRMERKNYKCAKCRRTFTVRVGTIFEDSKLPLRLWFTAIYQLTTCRAGVSSVELSDRLDITQKTAWFMLQRIQYAISHKSFQKPLSGTVEVDEYEPHFRKPGKGKRQRVLGIIQRGGEVRTEVIDNVGHQTITPLVQKHVEKGSKVMSDKWRGYDYIEDAGYEHDSVGHRAKEYVRGETHINTAEGYFSNFHRRLHGIHIHVSKKHMQKYCDMYEQRYNTRQLSPIERFETWFQNCTARLTYKALTA